MITFLARFVAAGLIVASLPLIANRLGDRPAGIVLLFPAVTLCGLIAQAWARGVPSLVSTTLGALIGLPTVAAFILTVHFAARARLPLLVIFPLGVSAWLLTATVLLTAWPKSGG